MSVAILACDTTAEKARVIGLVEVFFGLGEASGPFMGSLLYAACGYEGTFVSFGIFCALTCILCHVLLPSSTNGGDENVKDDKMHNQENPVVHVGINLLFDQKVLLAYFAGFIGQIAFQFNSSYITLHMRRRYDV